MKSYLKLIPISLFIFLSGLTIQAQGIKVTNMDGGSVVTELSADSKINDKSSLRRTWYVMNDSSCPIQITGAGIKTDYKTLQNYSFIAAGSFTTTKEVRAFEIHYILFDMFGNYLTTLSKTEVKDVSAGSTKSLTGYWNAEEYVSDLLTVVTFVSQVRTEDGNVWQYDSRGIVSEFEKIKLKSAGVLDQKANAK